MRGRKSLLHVKVTRAKGREYCYFRTGRFSEEGREILAKLPPRSDLAGFGASYASYLAARTRREALPSELTFPQLCDLWEKSPRWTRKKEAEPNETAPRRKKKERPYAEGTKKLYRISLDYARARLPTAPAALVEQQDIARLIDERADEPGAANSILRTINSLYKWARSRGHVPKGCDPGREIEELEVGEHEPWRDDILKAALGADNERVRLAVHLLYFAAQRIEDTVRMKGADRREDGLHVVQQKSGREMVIPIHSRLAAELERHSFGLDYIIPGAKPGQPLDQHTLRVEIQAWVRERFGVHVVPHGLRKNAVNALLEAGCSSAETAAISGQSLQMVEHYAKRRAQPKLARGALLKWDRNAK